jgi:hypothetical protein
MPARQCEGFLEAYIFGYVPLSPIRDNLCAFKSFLQAYIFIIER